MSHGEAGKIMNNHNFIYPVQPSFVLESDYYYKKRMDDYPFAHFYQFKMGENAERVLGVPDCTIDIIIELDGTSPRTRMYGMVLNSWQITTFKKHTTYFGVRLLPGFIPPGWRSFFPGQIRGVFPIEELGVDQSAFSDITEDMEFTRKIERFVDCLNFKGHDHPAPGLFSYLVESIFRSGGNITVDQLEKETGYTTRYINKVFHQNLGIGPKTFISAMKFQKAIQALTRGDYVSFAELAHSMGYYDQSAFTQDFKKFTSYTPKNYITNLKERKYQSLIQEY